MSELGLIGLGLLGSALVSRLRDAGFDLVGYDLRPEARAAFVGTAVDSPGAVLSLPRVLLSLPTSDTVSALLTAHRDALRPGTTLIDTTTGAPDDAVRLTSTLAASNVRYVEATVLGSSQQARAGDIVLMTTGDTSGIDDVLAALTPNVFRLPNPGDAARMKLAANLVLGLHRAVLAEGLTFAAKLGLDPAVALDVLKAGATYSRVMDVKGAKMLAGDFAPVARLSQHLKDVRLILDASAESGAYTPLSAIHELLLSRAESLGLGDADNAAVIRAFDHPPERP